MAKKMVDDILAAESEGRAITEKADSRARDIVNNAKAQAQTVIEQAKRDNEKRLREAQALSVQNNERAADSARAQTDAIKEKYARVALKNRDAAINSVIEILKQ